MNLSLVFMIFKFQLNYKQNWGKKDNFILMFLCVSV